MKSEIIKNIIRNTNIFMQLVSNLDREEMLYTAGQSNTIAWILGHVTYSRALIIKMLGSKTEVYDYEEKYRRGADKQLSDDVDFGKVLEILKKREEVIIDLIKSADEEKLSSTIEYTFPDGSNNLINGLSFLAWHETFHLGQIDLIKVANGLGGIK